MPDRIRTHAVELYCRELCGSESMPAAAAEVLESISPADAGGGDDQLLRLTRTAAARRARRPGSRDGWRGMLSAEREAECHATPALLAQRANGELIPGRQLELERHLEGCLVCRAAELRERRAARAFLAVLTTGAPATGAAASVADGPAPAPGDPADVPMPAPGDPADGLTPAPVEPEEVAASAGETAALAARRGFAVYPADRGEGRSRRAASPPRRGGHRRQGGTVVAALAAYRPFLATLALGALLILVVALAVGGGTSGQSAATSLPPPAPSSTPPAAVGIAVTRGAGGSAATAPGSPTTTGPTTTATTSSAPGPARGGAAQGAAPGSGSATPVRAANPPAGPSASGNSAGSSSSAQSGPTPQQGGPLPVQPPAPPGVTTPAP